ncbi:acetylxylan esterase [Leifsonia sp. 21MFCrub1.1]|uniref:acetylxylan esterase n=1 Tax=Leifsonia sp. 21MFCrub1.1 TaxID=1798223 RepID=UPI000892829C|nr:acetylxylan esterase [Leifsonia sp. 21MFCrub1.1]SEB09943.1 cephalosporin-C deacetylase [Leifsonia sp. 21MFCrub1.1]
MPRFDLPLDELREYRPVVNRPADFTAFWETTIATARAFGGEPDFSPVDGPLRSVRVFDVRFPGFAGNPIAGWLLLPAGDGPHPAVVVYLGYGAGRGLPHEYLPWVAAGYACFVMDTRGQGAGFGVGGVTPDPHGSGPANGMLARGIEDPATYYYRRVYTDAVRAVDAVRQHPDIDPARVSVAGGSQGGGIALAAAGLTEGLGAALIDVPFLCHFERAIGLTGSDPYSELVRYLAVRRDMTEIAFQTLSYFDGVNLAAGATAPALFSVALLDQICPPSTVFAAYNAYAGEKEIVVYPFNGHEGGASGHWPLQIRHLEPVLTA